MSLRNTYKTKRKNVEEQKAIEDREEIDAFLEQEAQAKIDLDKALREQLGEE